MIPITTSISIRVKAADPATGGVPTRRSFMKCRSPFTQFLLHTFAEPLLDHALVIQVTGPSQAFDSRQHAGIDSQSDGDRLGGLGRGGDRVFHQAQVGPVFRPKGGLGLFPIEERNLFPTRNRVHVCFHCRARVAVAGPLENASAHQGLPPTVLSRNEWQVSCPFYGANVWLSLRW